MKNSYFLPENPFLVLLMPLLAGIFLGVVFPFDGLLIALKIIIYANVLVFFLLNLTYQKWKIYRKPWLGSVIIHVFLFCCGILFAEQNKEINQNNHFSKQKADALLLIIKQEPRQNGDLLRFNARVAHTVFRGKISAASGSLLVTLKLNPNQKTQLSYGDELLVSNQYKPVDAPFNPAEFNYKMWLQHQNIYFQTYLNPNQYQFIAADKGNPVIANSLKIRKLMVDKFQHYLHNQNAIAVASTLILGYRADLSQDVLQAYSKTGTMHVLSVSGMHVALVYLIIELLLRFLTHKRSTVLLKAFISIALIWFYALLSGFSPAVCRAAVMISFVICGKTYNRHISMLNILLVSAFMLLLYNPNFITDVGFQLSYLAVFGLILLQPVIKNSLNIKQKYLRKLWSLLSVSLTAQIITFPLSVFYFHQFPVYFLLSNLFIVLPSMLIMYIGITFLAFSHVPIIAKPLAFLLEKTIIGMNSGLFWIENIRFGSWDKLWISTAEYLLLYAIIACVFCWTVYRKNLLLKLNAVFIILFLAGFSYKRFRSANQQEIVILNLRKNFGLICKNGNEAFVITDLQTSDKSFRYSVQPFLDSCRAENIHLLKPGQDFSNAVFSRQKSLLQFKNKLIFIVDRQFEQQHFLQKIKADVVLITGNPKISLNQITRNLIFDLLVVDATNPDYRVKKLTEEAFLDGRKIFILKRNNCLRINSN
ncbi:ComEC/Rec2 family competence protein [Mucilaginibacter sp.]|uniref:ComEC/Rec2 family competence protein n=1 Tax=Mucilaginibacter sp. TaxID=1882438 RepID=UPI003B008C03